jgi:hypothetical protein
MNVCGQHFTPSVLDRIQETVRAEPSISLLDLSRRVCEWLNWFSPNNRMKDMSCRKALGKLNAAGVIELPKENKVYAFTHKTVNLNHPDIPEIQCSLGDLCNVRVEPVSSRYAKESKLWFALLERCHYLGNGNLCGAQIRYLVKSSRGCLGALAFSAASWSLKERDKYIGWTEGARRAHLDRVICNSRFLILPTVKIPNLASHVLSLALSRVAQDWEDRYHIRPVLVETFVDPSRSGTSYRAANFVHVGESAGRRDGVKKMIFVHPLCPDWREALCDEPEMRIHRPEAPRHWAEEEFGTVRLYDNRLKERLYMIAQDFYSSPEANIPEACGSQARIIGAYRFFQNPKVNMDTVLTPHTEAAIERIKQHRVVLCPQDTTILDYATHTMTEGLGPTCHTENKAIGLILHDTLAFTETGTPLGVVDAQVWARDPKDKGKKYKRSKLPIEQKESIKWFKSFRKVAEIQKRCPETLLVSMGDRESDIYELFLEATAGTGPALLIRADKARKRKVDQQEYLWDFMAKKDVAGSLKIHIPHSGSRVSRDAWLDVRFAKVTLRPPQGHSQPIRIWAVHILEQVSRREREIKDEPIEWMLFTTIPVETFADAKTRVEWYSGRWGIEVFHRTLKSGCRIKDRQLEAADRLETCLGMDMVVAWRVYYLTMLGRETPDVTCTAFFKEIEWKALCCLVNRTPIAPQEPPTIGWAVRMIAKLGGHMGRKGDGFPGTQTIWRGLVKLYGAIEMYAIFTQQSYHPLHSGP